MGKKIVVSWQGANYRARYQVDTVTGAVKDLNGKKVDKDDLKAVMGQLYDDGKPDIARVIQNKHFG